MTATVIAVRPPAPRTQLSYPVSLVAPPRPQCRQRLAATSRPPHRVTSTRSTHVERAVQPPLDQRPSAVTGPGPPARQLCMFRRRDTAVTGWGRRPSRSARPHPGACSRQSRRRGTARMARSPLVVWRGPGPIDLGHSARSQRPPLGGGPRLGDVQIAEPRIGHAAKGAWQYWCN